MWDGPYGNWGSRKYLLASLDQSLKRMGLEYVDIFYHHRMDPETPLEETMGALAQCGAAAARPCMWDFPITMEKHLQPGGSRSCMKLHCPFVINQNRYSIFDRTVEEKRTQERPPAF